MKALLRRWLGESRELADTKARLALVLAELVRTKLLLRRLTRPVIVPRDRREAA